MDKLYKCRVCQADKPAAQMKAGRVLKRTAGRGVKNICKVCDNRRVYLTRKRKDSPEAKKLVNQRRHLFHLQKKYGIPKEQFIGIYDDRKLCALCGSTCERLVIDHDHTTGKIRDLICNRCNTGLGIFKDDIALLKKAIVYLRKHGKIIALGGI